MKPSKLLFLFVALGAAPLRATEYVPYDELPERRRQEARTHFQRMLAQPQVEPFKFALAALYLNERVDEANAGIIKEIGDLRHSSADGLKKKLNGKTQHPHLDLARPDETKLQPDVAGSEYIKWKSRTINRVYYLFNSKSTHFPGRLSAKAEEQMHELFFAYARKKSVCKRLSNVWINNSSENHEMMANANAYLYLQVLKDHPRYAERKLDDGFTVRQHHEAWVRYFKSYCLERARWGLFWEVYSPTYGKYFVPDIYNIYDFSQNPELQQMIGDLISLLWADWACNQLNGVTGGAKTRNYLDSYMTNAWQDSYFNMSRMQLARTDGIGTKDKQFQAHSAHNTGLQTPGVMYTTTYRLPRLVYDLMTQKDEKGRFTCRSIRPAREREHPKGFDTSIYEDPDKVRIMWAEDSKVVKYTWYTPHYIMGTFLLSPLMEYEAGPKQNRFCSMIFDTEESARIVPVCNHPTKPKTYRQHIYLQHENVMIVAKNTYNSEGAKVSRVYFSKGMKERLVSYKGWYLLEEGESYAAVKPAPYNGGSDAAVRWIDKTLLEMSDDSTPIILVGGDRETHPSLDHFKAYLDRHTLNVTGGKKLTYTFTDSRGKAIALTLFKDVKILPQINEVDVKLSPDYTFDGPYVYSPNGSGLAIISFVGKKMVLDFTGGRSLAVELPAGTGKKSAGFRVPVAGLYRLFLKTSRMADSRGPEVNLGGRKYQTASKAPDASWYYTVYDTSGVKEFKLPAGNLELKLRGTGAEGVEYALLVPASKDWKE